MYKNTKMNNKGFTLIELTLVMMIISIIVLLAMPRYLQHKSGENTDDVRTREVEIIEPAEERFEDNDNSSETENDE